MAAGGWRGRLAYAGRLVVLVAGLFCFACGIVLTLHSGLGLGPWDVFHQGLSRTQQANDAVDFGRFQSFFQCERWQDCGQPLC